MFFFLLVDLSTTADSKTGKTKYIKPKCAASTSLNMSTEGKFRQILTNPVPPVRMKPHKFFSLKCSVLTFDILNNCSSDPDERKKRSHVKGTSYSVLGKNSGNILPHAAPVQPVHGRVDWAEKYGSHR